MKGSPCSPQLENACAKQQRLNAARNKYINKLKKFFLKSHFNTHSPEVQREVGKRQQEIYIFIPLNWLTNTRGCHLVPGTQPRPGSLVCALSNLSFEKYFFLSLTVLGLGCGTQNLQLQHVGSGSGTRGRTQAPCIGSVESQPLDRQGSPCSELLWYIYFNWRLITLQWYLKS